MSKQQRGNLINHDCIMMVHFYIIFSSVSVFKMVQTIFSFMGNVFKGNLENVLLVTSLIAGKLDSNENNHLYKDVPL